VRVDRGGDVTFHGPGQLVGYPILDIRAMGIGPAAYVRMLESMLIDVLAKFGFVAERRDGFPGAWCGDAKIASIGVRVSRGVTTHGFALNVDTDLSWFDAIVPCGLVGVRMTSMARELGQSPTMASVEEAVVEAFAANFGIEAAIADRVLVAGGAVGG
jgi:lipoate-protein ligase B